MRDFGGRPETQRRPLTARPIPTDAAPSFPELPVPDLLCLFPLPLSLSLSLPLLHQREGLRVWPQLPISNTHDRL